MILLPSEEILSRLEREGVRFVELGLLDFNGFLRTRTVKLSRVGRYFEHGMRIDGYSVGYREIEVSDAFLVPDPSSVWLYMSGSEKIALVFGDLYTEEGPIEYYPRFFLKKLLERTGYDFRVGAELEFYVLRDGNLSDNGFYMSSYPTDRLDRLKMEFMAYMEQFGVDIVLTHHEVGPGQHEFLTPHFDPVRAGDFIAFFKKALKSFFWERGYQVTFMPKPFQGKPGNGMHVHLSMHDGGKNLFVEDGEMTDTMRHFMGGILQNARSIAVFTNPTVNSYKRLVPGFEAPIYLVWGLGNRSAYIRVPMMRGDKDRMRIEVRAPDSSGNVYLMLASLIIAGMDGIERKLDPGEEYRKNVYKYVGVEDFPQMPSSLMESIEEASRSGLLREEMGGELLQRYIATKEKEWKSYLNFLDEHGLTDDPLVVTEWEKNRYMDV